MAHCKQDLLAALDASRIPGGAARAGPHDRPPAGIAGRCHSVSP